MWPLVQQRNDPKPRNLSLYQTEDCQMFDITVQLTHLLMSAGLFTGIVLLIYGI